MHLDIPAVVLPIGISPPRVLLILHGIGPEPSFPQLRLLQGVPLRLWSTDLRMQRLIDDMLVVGETGRSTINTPSGVASGLLMKRLLIMSLGPGTGMLRLPSLPIESCLTGMHLRLLPATMDGIHAMSGTAETRTLVLDHPLVLMMDPLRL